MTTAWASDGTVADRERERLPDGRTIKAIGDLGELNRIVRQCGIDVAPTAGRATIVAAYLDHIGSIHDAAGRQAVEAWFASKRSAP